MTQDLIDKINKLLKEVTPSNFSKKYDELATIIYSYNNEGTGRETIIKILNQHYDTQAHTLDPYQDEVLVEIISCVEGFCAPNKKIDLV